MSAHGPALELAGITKRFGDTTAVEGVDLRVNFGAVHVLLGENGAGKTTLLRIAAGLLPPDEGRVVIPLTSSAAAAQPSTAGATRISLVHQHFSAVPALTVAENVALGRGGLLSRFNPGAIADELAALHRETGLVLPPPNTRVADLEVAEQQRVEIAKALLKRPGILMLDEPTSTLSPDAGRDLYRWLGEYAAGGHAVVVVTHRISDALAFGTDVTVLRHGRVALRAPRSATNERELLDAMFGAELEFAPDPASADAAAEGTDGRPVVIALRGAGYRDDRGVEHVANATLDIRAGEIVGVAGIDRSGHSALLRLAAGRIRPTSGSVVRGSTVAFVPEDRLRDALIGELSLEENFLLRGSAERRGWVSSAEGRAKTAAAMSAYAVRAADTLVPAAELSGGNQQRFVLSRELADQPRALVAEHPTRGLDARSGGFVRQALRSMRERGGAVLLYSADIDELLAMADRIVVCHRGRVIAVSRDRAAIARAMAGTA